MVPVAISANGRTEYTYALLDTGANCDAIDMFLVKKLQMETITKVRTVSVFDRRITAPREYVSFEVGSLISATKLKINGAIATNVLTTTGDKPPTIEDIQAAKQSSMTGLSH